MTEIDESPPDSKSVWFITGAIGELLAWGVLLLLLLFLVPHQRAMLQDFGVPAPRSVVGIIAASNLVTNYWYIAIPSLTMLVLGSVYVVVGFCRTPIMRLAMLTILAVVPLGWALWCHLAMMAVTSQLIQALS